MTFQEALISVINDFGKDILAKNSFVNILSDYNAYEESKAFKVILKNVVTEGYLDQLLLIKDWNSTSVRLISRFIENTGFQSDKAEYVLNSLAFALGISKMKACYTQANTQATQTNQQASQPQPQQNQQPLPNKTQQTINNSNLNLTSKQLEKLSDDALIQYKENAETYLDSIIEIKGDYQKELGVNLNITSDYDPDDNSFIYRMEIDGKITAKYDEIYFKFVIYRTDGRAVDTTEIYCSKNKRSYQVLESNYVYEKAFKTIGNISKVVMYWEML
jgi:hypothetical protein